MCFVNSPKSFNYYQRGNLNKFHYHVVFVIPTACVRSLHQRTQFRHSSSFTTTRFYALFSLSLKCVSALNGLLVVVCVEEEELHVRPGQSLPAASRSHD